MTQAETREAAHRDKSRMARWSACTRKRSEEHTSELQSLRHLVCRLLLEKKKNRRTEHQRRSKTNRHRTELPEMGRRVGSGAADPGTERSGDRTGGGAGCEPVTRRAQSAT